MVPSGAGARRLAALVITLLVAGLGLLVSAIPSAAADGTVRGVVTASGSGAPLGGLTVQAFCWEVTNRDPGELCAESQTLIDGSYALTVPAGTYKVFFAGFPTHRSQFYGGGLELSSPDSLNVVVPSGGSISGISTALLPLRSVSGTVTSGGEVLPGINVTAYQLDGGAWVPSQGTLTGPDGSYALHLADGTYRVGFSDADGPYRTVFFDGAETVETGADVVVAGADVTGIDADMALNHPITGGVTVEGIDMPGVTVTAWQQVPDGGGGSSWEAVDFTETGPDGRYALYLPDGTYRVEFRTFQGIFPTVYYDGTNSLEAANDVVVAGAEVPDINAAIFGEDPNAGPAITGTVTVAGSGAPADGVFATAYRFNVLASAWLPVRSVPVGPDGGYAVHVPEGTYRIGFSHFATRYQQEFYDDAATVDEAADIVQPSEGRTGIDAELVENRSISGVITTDPLPDLPPGVTPTEVAAWAFDSGSSQWERVSFALSSPSGDYSVYVPDGTYRIGFTPFVDLLDPAFYDGVDNLGEATDVAVAGADVSNIDVHLKAGVAGPVPPWPAAGLLSAGGQDGWAPDVAVGPNGGATAVWYRRDGNHARVQATTRTANGTWSTPVTLSVGGADALDPQVGAGARGDAVAVWRRWDGSRYRVQASTRLSANNTWSAPVTLSTVADDAWDPQVGVSANGGAVVVWRQGEGSSSRIHTATLSAVGRWSVAVPLSPSGGDAWNPQVAVGPDGSAVATWSRYDGANYRVQATTRGGNGAWSAPAALSPAGADAWDPRVAVGADGVAAAVWRRWDGSHDRVEAATRPADGSWSAASILSAAGRDAHHPQVAVQADGSVTSVWNRFDGTHERVQTSSKAPGGSWSAPVTLSRAGQDGEDPQVAAGPAGRVTAVWSQSELGSARVLAAVGSPGGWSAAARLTPPSSQARTPVVAGGPDGAVAAVWETRLDHVDRVQGVVRIDPPGQHCSNAFGVDLNILFGVPEQFVNGPCNTVDSGASWRPLSVWITNVGYDAMPPEFIPAGATPLEDLLAKLESVRIVIDPGTKRQRTHVFEPFEALRIDRSYDEYAPDTFGDFPMAATMPRMPSLRAGDHRVRIVWTLSEQHCDGFTDVAEFSCLPAGSISFGTRTFTVGDQ